MELLLQFLKLNLVAWYLMLVFFLFWKTKIKNGIINTLKNNNTKESTKKNAIKLIKYSLSSDLCLSDDLLIFFLAINIKEISQLLLNFIFMILSNPTNKIEWQWILTIFLSNSNL